VSKKIPFGVQLARVINMITIAFNVVIALLLVAIAIPNFIRAAENAGKTSNPILLTVFAVIMFIAFCIPAILLIILNRALLRLKAIARVWQIVISCIFLFGFPVGTILNGIILYFMFFDKKTKAAFGS